MKARTDEEKGWKSLWQKDVVFENGSVSESYDGIVDLSAYAGKNLEFSISAMSSAISPSTTVIWKTLSLDVNTPLLLKKKKL